MKPLTRQAARLVWMLAVLAGCSSLVQPDTDRLAPWTTELRAKQSADAFGSVYARGRNKLVFVGAAHTEATDSLTFKMIDQAYATFDIDAVIVEGSRRSSSPNYEKLLQWAASQPQREGRQEGGETVPAVRGALAEGAVVWGGEPDDVQIRDALTVRGVSPEDVLGFYTLRSVPQWLQEQKLTSPDDPHTRGLIEAELPHNRERLGLPATILPSYAAWAEWYERTNGKPFGATFELEETGPLADGRYGSNRIAAAISGVRDAFLLETIADRLNANDTVLVVFGGSHLMILRPALDAMLGQPCYVGNELSSAAESSNTANRKARANCDM